ncbi:glycosyltransferase family 2 protein [Futiania mangrovi]|uniref:Glycosyltransferase family 2 protein n=1 Tax=Futiania mangrovi TaxID=2959716 RepID=A0A9J6PB54_9PROT|nr:glycosyltransferase family 2 protein [Futiania mangrovii]MCP1335366.1 glycosyltransferase family 2 protein [Futiania mangrovii]
MQPESEPVQRAPRIPVSVIVLTRNEEKNIAFCLDSLGAFAEVFVVDSASTDDTVAIAEAKGATVVPFVWNGRYPKKKQWALENCPAAHDWVLFVDADEQVTPRLAHEIGGIVAQGGPHVGYFAAFDYVFMGRVLRHGRRVHKLVLFRRGKGRFAEVDDLEAQNMWEVEGHYQPRIDGSVGRLRATMLHRDHDLLFHYFERHNRYSDWEAVVREKHAVTGEIETQEPARALLKRVFSRIPFRGFAAFLDSYVLNFGMLDGRAGFHYAVARGVYYWQVGLKQREWRAWARGGAE